MLGNKLIEAAAGGGGAGEYIEDLFSTWLYTGNSSTQTITNGIDLAGEGGLVWIKSRSNATSNILADTARGASNLLVTNTTAAEVNQTSLGITSFTSFTSSGFTLGDDVGYSQVNVSSRTYASWTFRKAPGFFDVVTYTGNGVQGRAINHNLGSVPGCIIVKCTSAAYGWVVYHRSTGKDAYLILSSTGASTTDTLRWNSTNPTSSQFTVGNAVSVNENGQTYVAYLFAHDEQIFGDAGDQSVIKCGSYTAAYPNSPTVNLGWEPQWLLIKRTDNAGHWILLDTMRGIVTSGDDSFVYASTSNAETSANYVDVTSTGFIIDPAKLGFAAVNPDATATYIYIAIRRGPMKKPTSGTEVFKPDYVRGTDTSIYAYLGYPSDATILGYRNGDATSARFRSRLTGASFLTTSSTAAETTSTVQAWDNMLGYLTTSGSVDTNYINWTFRRAPGFFDVVAYTGTGSARTVSHNLGVAPELMIVKRRNTTGNWCVYSVAIGATKALYLNLDFGEQTDSTFWNGTTPTDAVFTLGTNANLNQANSTHIAYLFATLPGISKVGSYTGTGTTLDIDCGFTSGARFVLIKRTDSTGDWYVWDTARGIVSGNDPYLLLNSTAAENTSTDYIDPLSSGFQISSTAPAAINASGGSYIFLAIA